MDRNRSNFDRLWPHESLGRMNDKLEQLVISGDRQNKSSEEIVNLLQESW